MRPRLYSLFDRASEVQLKEAMFLAIAKDRKDQTLAMRGDSADRSVGLAEDYARDVGAVRGHRSSPRRL